MFRSWWWWWCCCFYLILLGPQHHPSHKQSPSMVAGVVAAFTMPSRQASIRHGLLHKQMTTTRTVGTFVSSSSSLSSSSSPPLHLYSTVKDVAVVGGGLAGLSLAYHLLHESSNATTDTDHNVSETPFKITIYDKHSVGRGGASSVAGGLIHPLSPRGRLVHWGMEGLEATNHLVRVASQYQPDCVLRDCLYRVALTEKNANDIRETAHQHSSFCTWMERDEILAEIGGDVQCQGGIKLFNGCQVIHVPTYLKGLWGACQATGRAEWKLMPLETDCIYDHSSHDIVVYAAGAGMLLGRDDESKQFNTLPKDVELPVDLVRGQSVQFCGLDDENDGRQEAILGGKYVSPLPNNKVLVGATHEFKEVPLSKQEVYEEMKERSKLFASSFFDDVSDYTVTSGYRVQSRRGYLGRLPIAGMLDARKWIFTGLSSRGLLHHGIYGNILAKAILDSDGKDDIDMMQTHPHMDWWKKKKI